MRSPLGCNGRSTRGWSAETPPNYGEQWWTCSFKSSLEHFAEGGRMVSLYPHAELRISNQRCPTAVWGRCLPAADPPACRIGLQGSAAGVPSFATEVHPGLPSA